MPLAVKCLKSAASIRHLSFSIKIKEPISTVSNCITGLWSSVTALIFGGPGALLASAFGLPGPLEDRISRGVGPLRCRNLHCPRSQPLLERPHPLTGQSWAIKAWTLGPDSSNSPWPSQLLSSRRRRLKSLLAVHRAPLPALPGSAFAQPVPQVWCQAHFLTRVLPARPHLSVRFSEILPMRISLYK